MAKLIINNKLLNSILRSEKRGQQAADPETEKRCDAAGQKCHRLRTSGPHRREMIVRGAEERLVPILMTASATALALLPIFVGGNRPGHEIEHPMALVILEEAWLPLRC